VNTDWKFYFEKGKQDEQIRNLSNKFYNYRWQLLEEKSLINIFNEDKDKISFSSDFEIYLVEFFKDREEFKTGDYKNEIYLAAYDLFKKRLKYSLIKRLNEKKLCEVNFSDAYSFFKLIEAFKTINDTLLFRINNNEIKLYTPNESKTCLILVVIKVQKCQIYVSESVEIALKIEDLITLLKCKKSDLNTVKLIFQEEKLDLEIFSNKNRTKIKRSLKNLEIDLKEEGILDELLELAHTNSFEVNSATFNYLLSQSGRLSEAIRLDFTKERILFSEENSIGEGDIEWNEKIISNITLNEDQLVVYFSIEYFNLFFNFLFEPNPKIMINLEPEIPIKLHLNFNNLEDTYGDFFIAQRDPF